MAFVSGGLEKTNVEVASLEASYTSQWYRVATDLAGIGFHVAVDDGAGGSHTGAGTLTFEGTNKTTDIAEGIVIEDGLTGTKSLTAATIVAGTNFSQTFDIPKNHRHVRAVFTRTGGDVNDQLRLDIEPRHMS